MILHIGFDDTDSPDGGCTTYVAAALSQKLLKIGATFIDYPNLIRLNPNTPWKTRGNAAVCLRFNINKTSESMVKKTVIELIDKYGEFWCENTNPGVVFLQGPVPEEVKDFSKNAVQQIVSLGEAEELIQKHGLNAIGWKNRRGIIGGLAAVGGTLEGDHTFEVITYRRPCNWGTRREIDHESVRKMDKALKELTFSNVTGGGSPLIAPHGPDPVLYGVRGESPESVYAAYQMIREMEPVERWMIFRSNQGTDAHFTEVINVKDLKPYSPAVIRGLVVEPPETLRGGHVIFKVKDSSGEVDCAAYEPTGGLRHIVWGFIPGDEVEVYGGVRTINHSLTLNVEKIRVLSLADRVEYFNPSCPECGGSTESMGKNQGYRCKKCGYRGEDLKKVSVTQSREIKPGVYLPDLDAQRHLTKPLKRYGKEKKGKGKELFTPWIGFNSRGC